MMPNIPQPANCAEATASLNAAQGQLNAIIGSHIKAQQDYDQWINQGNIAADAPIALALRRAQVNHEQLRDKRDVAKTLHDQICGQGAITS